MDVPIVTVPVDMPVVGVRIRVLFVSVGVGVPRCVALVDLPVVTVRVVAVLSTVGGTTVPDDAM